MVSHRKTTFTFETVKIHTYSHIYVREGNISISSREHQQQTNDYTAQYIRCSCQLFIKNPLEYEFTFVTAGVDELRDGPRHDQPFLRG